MIKYAGEEDVENIQLQGISCYQSVKTSLLACEQAPGEPERSEGACRHSIDAAVL